MKYPYEPKSNRKLEKGEFWSIQLPGNQFGCGIVLDIPDKNNNRTMFIAGLIDWIGEEEPNELILKSEKIKIAAIGEAHIKTIKAKGEKIRAKIEIESIENYSTLNLDTLSTWGYSFINVLAEKLQAQKHRL